MKQITGKLFVLSVAYVPAVQKWEVLAQCSAGSELSSTGPGAPHGTGTGAVTSAAL